MDGEHHVQGRRPCRARLSISQLLLGAVRHAWLLCSICSRTKANGHYTGTQQTGEARCAVARAEQAKIGLLTFPKYDTVESAILARERLPLLTKSQPTDVLVDYFPSGIFCFEDGYDDQPWEHMPLLRMERIRRAPIADSTLTVNHQAGLSTCMRQARAASLLFE